MRNHQLLKDSALWSSLGPRLVSAGYQEQFIAVFRYHYWASLPKEFSHKQGMWEQRLATETNKIYV